MSLNSEIGRAIGRMNIYKGIVFDNLSPDHVTYPQVKEKYESYRAEVEKLRTFRNENPIRHIKCEKPWSREFFGYFPGSYEFCDVLEMWIDADDSMLSCLAQRKNGELFFAIPKYNHFGQCRDDELSTPDFLWDYHRKKHADFLERTCKR